MWLKIHSAQKKFPTVRVWEWCPTVYAWSLSLTVCVYVLKPLQTLTALSGLDAEKTDTGALIFIAGGQRRINEGVLDSIRQNPHV